MGSIQRLQPYHIIIIFMIITLMWILHSHISFLLFHVPGLILKMILITPTWIVGIIPGVLKTFLAISREVYYFPSPERHFRSQPADLCTTQPRCTETSRDSWIWSLHVDATIPVHQSFSRDTRYQCKASFGRVTSTTINCNLFFAYPNSSRTTAS